MARGWESKSVEQQQADMASTPAPGKPRLSAEQREVNRKCEGLQLSRRRLLQQLQASLHPGHRAILEQSILAIDKQLSSFEKLTRTAEPK